MATKQCPICGKEFPVTSNHPKKQFCSYACSNKNNIKPSKTRTYNCKYCGKLCTKWAASNPQYCSLQCVGKSKKGVLKSRNPDKYKLFKCPICSKEFHRFISTTRNDSPYCSRECANEAHSKRMVAATWNYRGGSIRNRGATWNTQRRLAIKRDGHKCQICGSKKTATNRLHVHHIKPFREFHNDYVSANQLSNLITLCRSCHSRVEWGGLPCPRPLF